jgi:hypothetical protein
MERDSGGHVCADGGTLIGAGNPATRFCRSYFGLEAEWIAGNCNPNRLMKILIPLPRTVLSFFTAGLLSLALRAR